MITCVELEDFYDIRKDGETIIFLRKSYITNEDVDNEIINKKGKKKNEQ